MLVTLGSIGIRGIGQQGRDMLATPSSTRAPSASEARVLYTLLDAASSLGRMESTAVDVRWRELDARLRSSGHCAEEAELMHELLVELDADNALQGIWIEERWRTVAARIAHAAEPSKSRRPF